MANNIITEPASTSPATGDWQELIAKDTKTAGGSIGTARLTNWDDTAEPQVAAGSRFEVNGSYYEVTANDDITGWAGISDGAVAYVYATPGAGVVAFSYSSTAPTWDSAKGGWFNGTARALFRLTRTNSTTWSNKQRMDSADDIPVESHGIRIYTASGTFDVPKKSVNTIYITGCAAGGNGGNGDGTTAGGRGGGGGGGGGEIAVRKPFTVTPGASLSVAIGTPGNATSIGTFSLNQGGAGGNADGIGGGGAAGAGGALGDGSAAGANGGAGGGDGVAGNAGGNIEYAGGGGGGGYYAGNGGGGGGGGGSFGLYIAYLLAEAGEAGGSSGGAKGSQGGGGGGGGGAYGGDAGNGGDGGYGSGGGGGGGSNSGAAGAGGAGGPAIIIVEW